MSPGRQAGLRDRAEAGGRPLSAALHGAQRDGSPWEEECTAPLRRPRRVRASFPTARAVSRRSIGSSIGVDGKVNLIGGRAEVDFYRVAAARRLHQGSAAALRADVGEGDIRRRAARQGFLRLQAAPSRPSRRRARRSRKITNDVAGDPDSSGKYDGAIWTQGSPQIEETAYWFNLLIDTTLADLPATPRSARKGRSAMTGRRISSIPSTYIDRASGPMEGAAIAPAPS